LASIKKLCIFSCVSSRPISPFSNFSANLKEKLLESSSN